MQANKRNDSIISLLSLLTVLFSLVVITFGAYTRLTDSGLGCPDWPGCYGHAYPSEVNLTKDDRVKAWIEMIHRYIAATLGFIILIIAYKAHGTRASFLSKILLFVVLCQGLLGMYTVTLKLYPIVVLLHLFGGITICSIAFLIWLNGIKFKNDIPIYKAQWISFFTSICIGVLLLQIFLGGWTSTNYAALVCPDFPFCAGNLLPEKLMLSKAFDLFGSGYGDSPGSRLDLFSLQTIHVSHRYFAVLVFFMVGSLCYLLLSLGVASHAYTAVFLAVLLGAQVVIGVINVVAYLPLWSATIHNFFAVLLLLTLIYIRSKLNYAKNQTNFLRSY